MPQPGWTSLLVDRSQFLGDGRYPIPAYSEFMPAPRVGDSPYGAAGETPFDPDDAFGWRVTEHEEAFQLRPGLQQVAAQLVEALSRLGRGKSSHGLSRDLRADNPYWPDNLAAKVGSIDHERYVVILPLALSRTQDDKGRSRWTLFGGSDQGPARPFWRGFFSAPREERPAHEGLELLRGLLASAYQETAELDRAGLRILPLDDASEGPLPSWTKALIWDGRRLPKTLRYLLTFRPFSRLPQSVQAAYLAGDLHLLPFPGSLLFWGQRLYTTLCEQLPLARQIPLLKAVARHEGCGGLRVPQSGWMHEPRSGSESPGDRHGPLRGTFRRTHRTARVLRDGSHDEVVSAREDRMAHVLFDASEAAGLYDKPMARNAQLWTEGGRLLIDGPSASREQLLHAARTVREGGLFGYRFQFPAMRVGDHEIYWHRPLVAFLAPGEKKPTMVPDAPLGYLTAYHVDRPDPRHAIELWPCVLERPAHLAAIEQFRHANDPRPHQTSRNCRSLLDARELLGGEPLPSSFALRLLNLPPRTTIETWLESLPKKAASLEKGREIADDLRQAIAPEQNPITPGATYRRTARRPFEVAFWTTIDAISTGRFPNRCTADCARDPKTRKALKHPGRDLEALGDYLLSLHNRSIARAGMTGRAIAADLPFHWRTDFAYEWSDGWRNSQGVEPRERDLIVMIPGRDRKRAIIMADHYDTAYMEDVYKHGKGPRLAAPGSDDNTSATVALLLAARELLEMSREGRLGCDVWLIHLTGEEYPADCLGARHLAQSVVQGTLSARLPDGRFQDLSGTRVGGVYVLDMVSHDNPRRPGVFQIAPGASRESMDLAMHAHLANEAWNASIGAWNRHPRRQDDAKADADPKQLPPVARHPLMKGEIRPHDDPRSTLYNTDGQIFSDAGIPVVLFMEDYDINRKGYHDTHDAMAGIDLAYGAALVAIAIESVARAAGVCSV